MAIRVIKRDGLVVDFDINRIINAIYKANLETSEIVSENIEEFKEIATIKKIINNVNQWCADETELSVEKIQDTVEQSLIKYGLDKTAKAYILYRAKRASIREGKLNISSIIRDLVKVDAIDNETARENGNINADSTMGSMLKIGSETSKWFNLREVIKPKHATMHISGDFHINDLDFYSLCTNCMQIPFDKLLKNGFSSGHGFIRPPSNIISASALVAVIFQASQNEFFGGQGCHALDFFLAPYVKKTFIKELIKLIEVDLDDDPEVVNYIKFKLEEYSENRTVLSCTKEMMDILNKSNLDNDILNKYFNIAHVRTDKATYQAMEALIHNLCTLQSRSGSQTVFSSINFGIDITPEGRMVSKNLMLAQEAGLGNGETAIFPITIMSLMEGYNLNEGDPNYDLFKLSCRVSAKRLYPNYNYCGSTWNKPYIKLDNYNTIPAVMGCRTRVIGNVWDPSSEITAGRGNLSFSTLNLPRLGIEAHGDIDKFFKDLDNITDEMVEQLLDRYKVQSNRKAKNFPFAVQEGIFLNSEYLNPEDKLGDTIRHGTLTIGFCGLAECLVALTGKHHGESKEAQELGLCIIKFMRDKMDRLANETKYNFSLMGAPAESTAGKFARLDQKKYGIIPGVTDKEYYTNSSHIPPAYQCTIAHKVNIEAPYHKLCNAGSIFYAEYDGDPLQNLDAFESIVKYACKKDMGYIAISHDVDRCSICHYVGIIGDTCPRCGRTEDSWPSRETLVALKKVYKNIEIPDWLE